MTPTMIFMAILFIFGCLVIGFMLFVLYDKMTRIIVAAVEMHARRITSYVEHGEDMVVRIVKKESDNILSDIKVIKRSIPNVISHLYHIEKSKLFGARLKAWRRSKQLTIEDVFRRTGISTGQISSIERLMTPSEDERGILERLMCEPDEEKSSDALEFEQESNELEV